MHVVGLAGSDMHVVGLAGSGMHGVGLAGSDMHGVGLASHNYACAWAVSIYTDYKLNLSGLITLASQ